MSTKTEIKTTRKPTFSSSRVDSSKFPESEKDPLAEKNDSTEQSSGSSSDCEDFFGFEADDLHNADDDVIVENTENENGDSHTNLADFKETDDEIIFVENNVEVIEIDDDDDEEVIVFKRTVA